MQNVLTDIKCGACAQFPIYSIVNRLFSFELCTFFGCCKTIGINPIALWLTGCADEILELHETNANINKGEKIRRNKKYIRIVRSTVDCRLTWNERIIWALDQACYCYIRMRYGLSLSLWVQSCVCVYCVVQRSLRICRYRSIRLPSSFAPHMREFNQFECAIFLPMVAAFYSLFVYSMLHRLPRFSLLFSMCVDSLLLLSVHLHTHTLVRRRTTARFRMFLSVRSIRNTHCLWNATVFDWIRESE